MRILTLLLVWIVMLASCADRQSKARGETIKDAYIDLQEAIRNGDPEAIANRYLESSQFTKESNLSYASSLLKYFKDSQSKVMHIRESGNFAAIVVVDVQSSSGSPMFAKKVDGKYRFYRSLNIWGYTNGVEHFEVSEEEMKILLKLQEWAISKTS